MKPHSFSQIPIKFPSLKMFKPHKISENPRARVKELYDANQAENPGKLDNRNIAQMNGRYKRLNESVGKWVGVYREAYRKRRSGMSMKDNENEAHKLYETSGSKFNDTIVFNKVMCKHRKWDLQLAHDAT
uniref:Uncharacterized protein n=1 Tax=Lactuca sativa TaxID=4236 RepID=A0A9R1W7L3_LACSA|nr:hypothetical protein LSAT_V11C300137910 [Lactuca sativa]